MSINNLVINRNECINCGICISSCPAKIYVKHGNNVTIDNQKEIFCINCGDCSSVCPNKAIQNKNEFEEEAYIESKQLKPEQLLDFFKLRRSVRSYKPINLSAYEKEYLSQIASFAPRGGHTQSIRNTGIIIVENKELIENVVDYTYEYIYALKKKLSSIWVGIPKAFNSNLKNNINDTVKRIDLILSAKQENINMLTYNSPNLIFLHNEKSSPISKENLTIMEYQLMLGAETLNLGTCFLGWVSFAMQSFQVRKSKQYKQLYELLEIPIERQISGVFSIGQKNSKYKKVKKRDKASVCNII